MRLLTGPLSSKHRGEETQRGFIERALLELMAGIGVDFAKGFVLKDDASIANRAQIQQIIDSSYSDPITSVDSIAKTMGFSRRQIYRLFEGREVSIAKLIRERRVDRAELLLRLPGNKPISAIATESGFGGTDQLARAFRERHGRTPLEYRTRIRNHHK